MDQGSSLAFELLSQLEVTDLLFGMCTAAVVSGLLLGGVWRRWWGGWAGGPRWIKLIAAVLLCAPAWMHLPPITAVFTVLLAALHWVPGNWGWDEYDRNLFRYGYAPALIGMLWTDVLGPIGMLIALTGPLTATWYDLVQRYKLPNAGFLGLKDFFDGPIAAAEFLAGYTFFGFMYIPMIVSLSR